MIPHVCYLAGPYRDKRGAHYILENILVARRVAARLWNAGVPVVCPHLNTALMDGAAPDEHFLQGDITIMERCDIVVLLPRWETSSGTLDERAHAMSRSMPVVEWSLMENLSDEGIRAGLLSLMDGGRNE